MRCGHLALLLRSGILPAAWPDVACLPQPENTGSLLTTAQDTLSAAKTTGWLASNSGKSKEIWVGETSSTYGGGTANASASFVAGFMWLDKLALAARLNHSVVCRQVFGHARYSAVGYDNVPNPDYYSALLWRRLVGRKVLEVEGDLQQGRDVRVYAFCTAEGAQPKGGGAVTVVWLNTQNQTSAALQLRLSEDAGSVAGERHVWALTSQPGLPTSRAVYLNGDTLLSINSSTGLPVAMPPAILPAGESSVVTVPALSYGFVVLPGAGAGACPESS